MNWKIRIAKIALNWKLVSLMALFLCVAISMASGQVLAELVDCPGGG